MAHSGFAVNALNSLNTFGGMPSGPGDLLELNFSVSLEFHGV